MQNIACLGKTVPLCSKQNLSNIWDSSNTKAELKKSLAHKKRVLNPFKPDITHTETSQFVNQLTGFYMAQ